MARPPFAIALLSSFYASVDPILVTRGAKVSIYVGVDRRGVHYVFPVQAKGGSDRISIVQIEQDFALCAAKFPALICRPIAAQFMRPDLIALFDFVKGETGVAVSSEKHYRLVPPEELTADDLKAYLAGPQ
jgi:hypothetical protein